MFTLSVGSVLTCWIAFALTTVSSRWVRTPRALRSVPPPAWQRPPRPPAQHRLRQRGPVLRRPLPRRERRHHCPQGAAWMNRRHRRRQPAGLLRRRLNLRRRLGCSPPAGDSTSAAGSGCSASAAGDSTSAAGSGCSASAAGSGWSASATASGCSISAAGSTCSASAAGSTCSASAAGASCAGSSAVRRPPSAVSSELPSLPPPSAVRRPPSLPGAAPPPASRRALARPGCQALSPWPRPTGGAGSRESQA